MEQGGCAVATAGNIASSAGYADVHPGAILDDVNNFNNGNIKWGEALKETGLEVSPREDNYRGGALTEDAFNQMVNDPHREYLIGARIQYSSQYPNAEHWVGIRGMWRDSGSGVLYFEIDRSSTNDAILANGGLARINNRGGLGWREIDGNIFVPASRVTGYRTFSRSVELANRRQRGTGRNLLDQLGGAGRYTGTYRDTISPVTMGQRVSGGSGEQGSDGREGPGSSQNNQRSMEDRRGASYE